MTDLDTIIWRMTGWASPRWSKRDNDGRLRYWNALVESRKALKMGKYAEARQLIDAALRWH